MKFTAVLFRIRQQCIMHPFSLCYQPARRGIKLTNHQEIIQSSLIHYKSYHCSLALSEDLSTAMWQPLWVTHQSPELACEGWEDFIPHCPGQVLQSLLLLYTETLWPETVWDCWLCCRQSGWGRLRQQQTLYESSWETEAKTSSNCQFLLAKLNLFQLQLVTNKFSWFTPLSSCLHQIHP